MALVPPKSSVCPPVAACSMGVGKGAGPPWCPCTGCLWRCPHAGGRAGCGSGCPREAKKRGKETTWGGKELGLAALRPSGCAPHAPVWDLPRLGSSTGWDRPSLSQGPALPAPLQVPPQALCDPHLWDTPGSLLGDRFTVSSVCCCCGFWHDNKGVGVCTVTELRDGVGHQAPPGCAGCQHSRVPTQRVQGLGGGREGDAGLCTSGGSNAGLCTSAQPRVGVCGHGAASAGQREVCLDRRRGGNKLTSAGFFHPPVCCRIPASERFQPALCRCKQGHH